MVKTSHGWGKIPTWIIVAVGLAMNIAAALLTHLMVDKLSHQSAAIEREIANNTMLIEQVWRRIETLERKKEWLLLVDVEAMSESQREATLAHWVNADNAKTDELLVAIDSHQIQFREDIDARFLKNLQFREQENQLEIQVSRYRNLALFLQIMGLALILARDLRRY
ncbi:DNA mismatch repair protein [Thaumasiovibrio sp. DFM-14]|uniref:DNA mismatch repair protein n=1 Tax=Thaumasiovibrio sp. DFM-14 TaxID=3384792 RepID=UPI0039A3538F